MDDALSDRLARLSPDQRAALARRIGVAQARPKLSDFTGSSRRESRLGLDQERIWLLHQQDPSSTEYVLTFGLHILGRFDRDAFVAALERAVERHAILRSSVTVVDGLPRLRVSDRGPIDLVELDLRSVPEHRRGQEARNRLLEHVHRPFDLADGPVLRVVIVRLGDEDHQIAEAMHHSTTDQWSYALLNRELLADYKAMVEGRILGPAKPPAAQFGDFAEWQRAYYATDAGRDHLEFWPRYLEGAPTQTRLPYDRSPESADKSGEHFTFVLDADVGAAFLEAVRSRGMTVSSGLVAAYASLLFEETGQTDVIIGLPSVTRSESGSGDILGFLLSTLPFRVRIPERPTLDEVLTAVRESAALVADHRETPFSLIVDSAAPARRRSRYPLVQTAHVHLNFADTTFDSADGMRVYANAVPEGVSTMDITVAWWQAGDQFYGRLEYRRSLFDRDTIARMARRLLELVAAVATDPGSPLRTPQGPPQLVEDVLLEEVFPVDGDDLAVGRVRELWAELVGDESFGDDSSFLDGAGASLLSLQLVQRLDEEGIVCSIADVLESCTPRVLASRLSHREVQGGRGGGNRTGPVRHALSPEHEALFGWGLSRMDEYAHSVVVSLPEDVELGRLRDALHRVLEAHPALRTTFDGGAASVSVAAEAAPHWIEAGEDADPEGIAREHRARLNLREGPLFVASADARTRQMVLTAHHAVIDGYSWNVVVDDLRAALEGAVIEPEPVAYGEYVSALNARDATPQAGYWLAQMRGEARSSWALSAPNDYSAETTITREVGGVAGHPLDDIALASLLTALVRSGQPAAVSTVVLGRQPVYGLAGWEAHRAVGYYASFFPFRPRIDGSDARADLREVRRARRLVPDGGKSFLLCRAQHSGVATAFSEGAYPEVGYNYLGSMSDGRDGAWARAQEIPAREFGTSRRASLADVSVSAEGHRAVLRWTFNPVAVDADAVARCADEMAAVLAEHLSDHGADAGSAAGALDVGQSDLDALFSRLSRASRP